MGTGVCGTTGAGYDCNGNVLSDSSGTRRYAYDGDNRLISVTAPAWGLTETLSYDPTGRLSQTVVNGAVTNFVWDDAALAVEYDNAGNVLRRYIHGPGVDNPFVWFEGGYLDAAHQRNLIADRQGSIIGYSDSTGTVPTGATYTYDAYGVPNPWSGSRFRYTGQIALPEAQLYYYKARVYDPAAGRFLQTDPVGYGPDLNWYVYVEDDPVDNTDPAGLNSVPADAPNGGSACGGAGVHCYAGEANGAGVHGIQSNKGTVGKDVQVRDANAYWRSEKGDPIKIIGQRMDLDSHGDLTTTLAKTRLISAIFVRDGVRLPSYDADGGYDPGSGTRRILSEFQSVSREYNQIRLELAQSSSASVKANGGRELSALQVAQYHWSVFAGHGLPRTTFGGTPLTGTALDVPFTMGAWCIFCKPW